MSDNLLTRQIRRFCADGYRLYDKGEYRLALRSFYQGWLTIPKPQIEHQQAGWVLTAIGDAYYKLKQYEQGVESLISATHCPGGDKSPFVYMRLGQCLWNLRQDSEARKYLFKAYRMPTGSDLLEQEDSRYLTAIADLCEHG
ncbi:hypothetical protein KO507_15435 [Gilvimarinus agarilyticus]|uniref:tetratricopeptide repeat protein n=1 Tax=unclassified Gilvimarinus TaxID=2642066 RepID=UPI001C0A4F3A|nr:MULTISPECIES: hypothetical protein [unclassified Gilvimarinus]MBU2887158.1 hypothetical protein [Gilvimarinus agarilyticus]MDO6571817.1 hypothetical protein [Gilvimarinus sp. 2_MG-2023]MDO6745890.1 hypothetical protein [Gilvimarinus sp. 1_MG-2023]